MRTLRGDRSGRTPRPMRPRRLYLVLVLLAAVLFVAGCLITRLDTRAAEQRFPPRGSFVHASPARLHYLEAGSGPTIVLLHGAFGTSEDFAHTLLQPLARTHRVLAFDRPGHGWSDRIEGRVNTPRVQAAAVRSAVHELGIEHPILLGFSYGGAVALAWALEFPGDPAALVLVNPASHPWPGGPSRAYSLPAIPLLGPIFTHSIATPFARILADSSSKNAFAPLPLSAEFSDHSPVSLELTPARFRANCEDLRVLADCLAADASSYPGIRVPTLILSSREDQVASFAIHSESLAHEIPGARLVPFSPAGHQLPYTHTDEVVSETRRFLDEHGL